MIIDSSKSSSVQCSPVNHMHNALVLVTVTGRGSPGHFEPHTVAAQKLHVYVQPHRTNLPPKSVHPGVTEGSVLSSRLICSVHPFYRSPLQG